MKDRLPKERVEISYGHNAAPIDYRYVNYDITAVERDYDRVSEELSRAQLALDAVNSSERFEAELTSGDQLRITTDAGSVLLHLRSGEGGL